MNPADLSEVEVELNTLTSTGSELHRAGPRATYRPDAPISESRLRFQRELLDELFEEGQPEVEKDRPAAVTFTAGPPGAGKSTAVRELHLSETGSRVIDPDEIKLRLLSAEVGFGTFDDLLARTLPDGYPIMLNELSSLVHNESVLLADRLIARSLEAQESVVVEGTFSWPGLKERYMRRLMLHDYGSVTLLSVELEQHKCLASAYERWAQGRIAAIESRAGVGGRFTPSEAITSIYRGGSRYSNCNKNAVDFFNDPAAELLDQISLVVLQGRDDREYRKYQRSVGEYLTEVPTYL